MSRIVATQYKQKFVMTELKCNSDCKINSKIECIQLCTFVYLFLRYKSVFLIFTLSCKHNPLKLSTWENIYNNIDK